MADLEFSKGGFQYAIKARVARLLGGSGGMPPKEKIWISDLLRSFLVYSMSEIPKVRRPVSKSSGCVGRPQN